MNCEDGSVRLSGENSTRGRLEICKGNVWGSVCAGRGYLVDFSTDDANVACGMLGQQSVGKVKGYYKH